MSDQHEGDPRDIEPAYASDGWASRRGYEIAMAWGDSWDHRIGQADEIAHEFRRLRDHMQAQIDALRQELAARQVFTDDYYAGYAAGMQTEREHQEALSRLVMRQQPPAPAVPTIPDDVAQTIASALVEERRRYIEQIATTFISPYRQIEIDRFNDALAWLDSLRHRAASDE